MSIKESPLEGEYIRKACSSVDIRRIIIIRAARINKSCRTADEDTAELAHVITSR